MTEHPPPAANPQTTQAFPPGPSLLKYAYIYFQERFDFLRLAKRLVREYGDLVHVQAGSRHHYFVNHPDLIEKVLMAGYEIRTSRPRPLRHALGRGLITSQGELHRTMRRLMQPIFHKNAVLSLAPMIVEKAEDMMKAWKSGATVNVLEEMTHLTLEIIIQVLFGAGFDKTRIKKTGKAAYLIHRYMHQDPASHINMRLEFIPFIGRFITRAARARLYLDKIIYGMIKMKRAENNFDGPDLLSMLLRLKESHPEIKDLHDKQIRDEILTMFVAGHETTANALTWTWYLLAQHPDVENKLHQELDQVLDGKPPTAEDLPKLNYTRMVFLESMRIYPPVWTLGRRPEGHDFELGGWRIPNRSMLLLSPYVMHHDERFWPDPERFDPERFRPEEEAKRPRFAYFPFAGGNRKCFGEGFASMEGPLLLASIAQRWRLKLLDQRPIQMESMIALKPKRGIRMVAEQRMALSPERSRYAEACSSPAGKAANLFS